MAAELAVVQSQNQALEVGFTSDNSLNLLWRGGKFLAESSLVPPQYQKHPANCMIALNMAHRMNADPLMVMQNLYIVHNRPAWSAQFLIACFNKCGRFSSIRFQFFGERGQDSWGCRATATELATGEVLTGPDITIEMAKKDGWFAKNGSKWPTIPEQMLRYRAAAWFIKTAAPEIAMGFHTVDEVRDGYGAYDADADVIETAPTQPEPEGEPKKKSALDSIVDAAAKDKPTTPETPVDTAPAGMKARKADPSELFDGGSPFAGIHDA
jgi:hypothetical protein